MVDFSKHLNQTKGNKMSKDITFDMDAILDGTLDDLKDAPEFKPFPPGAHICTLKITQKKIDGWPAFELGLKILSTEELADTNDVPPEVGAETSVAYFMKHEKEIVAELGQGKFKEILKSAAEHFGAKSNRELIEDCNGATALVITGLRSNKDKTKSFTDIESVKFV